MMRMNRALAPALLLLAAAIGGCADVVTDGVTVGVSEGVENVVSNIVEDVLEELLGTK